ncbi:hypothetical protein [Emcibacter sp.]|uniref:GntP family permease n=1 Tax=Emcibacter sp. TaxID=1979954 RepID=UPI002AA9213D|nr:hypothetical protein [Emcibacter sp.]
MLSLIGLVGGLALLIYLTIRGVSIMIAAPFCALIVALTGDLSLMPQWAAAGEANFVSGYMSGFTKFIFSWFFMFLLGAIFGKVMEDSGAAYSFSDWVIGKLGKRNAVLAVVAACAILTYGGVSVFVVAFSVYPIALSLFKEANLPRRFIPATLAFGSVTFTMTSAGSPEIQNWIPIKYLGTTHFAGWQVSLVVALFMMLFGYWWLSFMVRRAVRNGERFETRSDDVFERSYSSKPHPVLSLLPLLTVLVVSFLFHETLKESALILALLSGVLMGIFLNLHRFDNLQKTCAIGATGAVIAIANTAAVVGFGTVAQATPAFASAVDFMTNLPGNELVGAAVAVTVIAGLTGSASGGQSIALPLLAPHYLDAGVNPEALHRVVAIASGALDSLPHNGYVVTTIQAICKETHQNAYAPMGALTVIVPTIGLIMAIALFIL